MEQAELDIALEELELRLERLRGLYEQYFLGLEKIEPSVARKDVDRRIYVLRREKIRNTAKRFKLQTVIQRYNTFQQYWQRICREIENGTYKRHLLRAQKIGGGELLTIAAKRRLGRATRASTPPADKPPESVAPPSAAVAASPAPQAPAPAPGSPPPPRARPPLPPPATRAAGRASEAAAAKAPPTPAATTAPPTPPKAFESLDLDMDFMGGWDPGKRPAPVRPPKQASPPAPPAPRAPPPRPPAPAARPVPAPTPRAAPPPRSPAEAPPPKPAPKPAAPVPAPAAAAPGMDDTRLRDLHARLQQAKQETKEGSVSFDGLAKSIRATEAKLRAQHKNRKIEFDVVIKDGRAVVKPIVR